MAYSALPNSLAERKEKAMTKTYLITLQPTGKFFFGGDMTFKVASEGEKFNEQFSSYIISSNKFPQQTSLLGMLRFLLLRNSGEEVFANNKIQNHDAARKLIGEHSFCVGKQDGYGMIKSISPCFLICEGLPVDLHVLGGEYQIDFEKQRRGTINGMEISLPMMKMDFPEKEYDAKCSLEDPMKEYFVEDVRVGIIKDRKESDKDALFKQINYRFSKENTQFAFYAEVDESIALTSYDGQQVSLGADSSIFMIGIQEQQVRERKFIGNIKGPAIVLESPAYLTKDDIKGLKYAITKVIPFKFMSTTVETKNYNRLKNEIKHSDKYHLYDTGAVFYFEKSQDMRNFVASIESHTDFREIGYNHYIINE